MSNYIKTAGEVTVNVGLVSLGVMAIVGTIAIDLVILAYILKPNKSNNKNHNNNDNNNNNSFFTGMLVGQLFSNQNRSTDNDLWIKLLLSPLFTAAAVVLSFVLGVPYIGIGLIIGWGVAMGITLLGVGLCRLAECFEPANTNATPTHVSVHNDNNYSNNCDNSYGYNPTPSAPPAPCVVAKQGAGMTMADAYCRMFHTDTPAKANANAKYVQEYIPTATPII